MKRLIIAAAVAVLFLGGCSSDKQGSAASSSASATTEAATSSTAPPDSSDTTTASAAAELPDPCTLFTDAEIVELTGRAVTQIDKDNAEAGATTRYCQWQLESGQLAVSLSQTTEDDFVTASQVDGAEPVDGVGERAYSASGHLYVYTGSIGLDIYSRGADTDELDLEDASRVAAAVIDKLQG